MDYSSFLADQTRIELGQMWPVSRTAGMLRGGPMQMRVYSSDSRPQVVWLVPSAPTTELIPRRPQLGDLCRSRCITGGRALVAVTRDSSSAN